MQFSDFYNQVPRVIAHRGANSLAPENTLPAFCLAAEQGASWIEFDVQLSSDGIPVIMHDETVDRTTYSTGKVCELSTAELISLDANKMITDYQGPVANVPTLAQALQLCNEYNLQANIELKSFGVEAERLVSQVLEVVNKVWLVSRPPPLFSSFDTTVMTALTDLASDYPRSLLRYQLEENWLQCAQTIDCVAIHVSQKTLTRALAAEIKKQGFIAFVYTVNDMEVAQELYAWGVDGVFSDVIFTNMPSKG